MQGNAAMGFFLLYGIGCSFLVVLKPKALAADTIIGTRLIIWACMEKVNPDLVGRDKQGRSYAEREFSEDRGIQGRFRVWGTNESGRSTNGHFASKVNLALDRLSHQEAPRHTQQTEGRSEQHHGRATIGDNMATSLGSVTGTGCAVCSVGRG